MTLKKMQKMKKGKVLIAIPEKCMYLSKRASLIFGSEPDFCRGQDGATYSSTTAHLRWVHLWKKDVYESTQLQELQVLHTTSSIPTTAHKLSNGKQNSPQFRSNHLSNPRVHESISPAWPKRSFSSFFTSSVLEHIVEQSNKYAAECMGEQFQTWQPITVDELCAYFGFMILMGIVRLPSLGDYWKKDMIYHYTPVAERISRDRFYDLHQYLHFADNSTLSPPHTPGYNKLGKISPIITMLRN